ncbi:MAG: V-type ATP synthase subunit I [Christensenellaceae bacterium]
MAIVEMQKFQLVGLSDRRKGIVEELQKSEIVEISKLNLEEEELARVDVARNISQISHFFNATASALGILDEYAPEKSGFFYSRKLVPIAQYDMDTGDNEKASKYTYRIIELADKIHEAKENLRRIDAKQIALKPYISMDVPMGTEETEHTKIEFGMLSGKWMEKDIYRVLSEEKSLDTHFEIISQDKEYTTVWFLYLKRDGEKMARVFQTMGLVVPTFSYSHHLPAKKIEVLEEAKKELYKEIDRRLAEIRKLAAHRPEIELLYDHLALRRQKYQEFSKAGLTEYTFMLQGYVPKKHAENLAARLEREHGAHVELMQPEPGEAPVQFRNNGFVRPVEGITATYSMPGEHDIDPNPIMAIFYYLFFGMMFSDAGYGLLMTVACLILGFGKVLEPGKRQIFRMFFFCGISTMFWGFMYGGFFGDATYTISSVFFGGDATLRPLWIDPTAQPLMLLVFSIMLGLIHLLIGMGIKVYMLFKQRRIFEAFSDHLDWMWILGCIFILATGMYLSTAGAIVPAWMNQVGIWGLVGGLVFLVVIKSAAGIRNKKNPVAAVLGGIISIYDITGFIGDILSYSRLLALGLATGVIANVINLMGTLLGTGAIGIIFFVIVFILGHIVNFAINALGAYVHTMRLQFVEYYSKFYEGGGKKFEPFIMDTKYYRFSKE